MLAKKSLTCYDYSVNLSLTLVEGKKPRKCCYYSFFRLFYFVKKCVPFSWFWSF